jgi:hypothetical protein
MEILPGKTATLQYPYNEPCLANQTWKNVVDFIHNKHLKREMENVLEAALRHFAFLTLNIK